MDKWIGAALDYIPRWIEFQMRHSEQPGCSLAVAYAGRVVLEQAWGFADLRRKIELTPRHRFRVASHSKSFTAAGILKLREQGRLKLDDSIGQYVGDLHPRVASATLAQLLSHSAGLVRDGFDAGQWVDRKPFLDEAGIRADLSGGPTIEPNTRFKYSNHGFGLAGMAIEAITGEPYNAWIKREIVDAAGLDETVPDMPLPRGAPFARGHSTRLPYGERLVIPADNRTNALASATGFVSTAGNLVRFFSQLSPAARGTFLSAASRREMVRRQWRDAYSSLQRWYGLGTISGTLGDWDWFGHSGGFQGCLTRTAVVPAQNLCISVLTNASDGPSQVWVDGAMHILRSYAKNGAPTRRTAPWSGRWWSLWGAVDLVPMSSRVLVATPAFGNPMADASEIEVIGRNRDGSERGRIVLAGGFANHGETARLSRDGRGRAAEVQLGGSRLLTEAKVTAELQQKYGSTKRR